MRSRAAIMDAAESTPRRGTAFEVPTPMRMFNPILETKDFAAHGHDRVHMLDGKPLASFATRAIAFAVDFAIVDIVLSLGASLGVSHLPRHRRQPT
jgi:hypothetical protein